ncbi:hypothetical protein NQ317_004190 [Molorchus minor]|uniref:Uncharacterized protein n=1 Tax=Molorchus minor TaxID=1323400 RepID=A0ABQ9JC20_9CUCU|nr:hypothetical protein NQ317_004190 [Molorchus minor]
MKSHCKMRDGGVSDIYVNDVITGCRSLQDAQRLKEQLILLCRSGGFELHKWNSNDSSLISDNALESSMSLDIEASSITKVLGLQWSSTSDTFSFHVSPQLARIFDPLGFLTPFTLFAKRLIQRIWTLGLDSTVTLSWIRSSPHKWKTFVSSGISHIQDKNSQNFWYYVPSENNPADYASRRMLPKQLIYHKLWWAGPSFLLGPSNTYLMSPRDSELGSIASRKEKRFALATVSAAPHFLDSLLNNLSSLAKIE